MLLIEDSSTPTAKEAWVIQRIGFVKDHKMIRKILAPDQHVQGGLNGAAFQNHQDYLCSITFHRLTKHGGHVYDLKTYLFQGPKLGNGKTLHETSYVGAECEFRAKCES